SGFRGGSLRRPAPPTIGLESGFSPDDWTFVRGLSFCGPRPAGIFKRSDTIAREEGACVRAIGPVRGYETGSASARRAWRGASGQPSALKVETWPAASLPIASRGGCALTPSPARGFAGTLD